MQVLFNVCVVALAVYITHGSVQLYSQPSLSGTGELGAGWRSHYFCANTFPVASIIGLTEGKANLSGLAELSLDAGLLRRWALAWPG